jgi:hypothetical protein
MHDIDMHMHASIACIFWCKHIYL